MHRPLLVAGSASFLTLVFAALLGLNACVVFAVFFFVVALVLLILRHRPLARVLSLASMVCALSFGLFALKYVISVHPALTLDRQSVRFSGRISEQPEVVGGKLRCQIQTSKIDFPGAPQKLKILVSLPAGADDAAYGDTVSGKASLFAVDERVRGRWYSKGIYLSGYATEIDGLLPAEKQDFYGLAVKVRNGAVSLISQYLPSEEGNLLSGLLIGVTDIRASTAEHFRAAGLSHLLAVSGQQVAILGQLCMALFALFSVHRRLAAALTALPIFFFMAITGFSFSILRAGLMYFIYLLGHILLREPDSLGSLGASTLLILLQNPFAALDAGFQLSVCATLGIIVLAPRVQGFFCRRFPRVTAMRFVDFIVLAFSQTLCAILFTLPVTIVVFGSVSLYAPLGNLLAALPVALILPLTGAAVAAHLFKLAFLSRPLFLICGLVCRYLMKMTAGIAKLPFAVLPAGSGYAVVAAGACLILVGAAILLYRGALPVRRLALLCLCIILCGSLSQKVLWRDVTSLRIFDFEDGFCVMLSGTRQKLLVGTGSDSYEASSVLRALKSGGRPVAEVLLLPTDDSRYAGGAAHLARSVNLLMMPESGSVVSRLKSLRREQPGAVYAPCQIDLWENAGAQVLQAGPGSFIRITAGDTVVLISNPGADAALLDLEHRRADLWITTSGIPKNAALLQARKVVLSGSGIPAQIALSRLYGLGLDAVVTGGAGDIDARTRGRGDLTLRRLRS